MTSASMARAGIIFFIRVESRFQLRFKSERGKLTLMDKQHPSRRGRAMAMGLAFCLVVAGATASAITISQADALRIGHKVWQNECNGSVAGLTSWNEGENFASLGIGHFIWYPKNVHGPFEESFPKLVSFISQRG